jgi:hypothetical protein
MWVHEDTQGDAGGGGVCWDLMSFEPLSGWRGHVVSESRRMSLGTTRGYVQVGKRSYMLP